MALLRSSIVFSLSIPVKSPYARDLGNGEVEALPFQDVLFLPLVLTCNSASAVRCLNLARRTMCSKRQPVEAVHKMTPEGGDRSSLIRRGTVQPHKSVITDG